MCFTNYNNIIRREKKKKRYLLLKPIFRSWNRFHSQINRARTHEFEWYNPNKFFFFLLNDFFVIHLELVGVRAFRFYWELTIRFSMTIFQNDTLCYPAESLVNLNASIRNLYLSAQQQHCSGVELCISKNLFVTHESSQPATILNENNSIFLIFICLYIFTDVFRDVDSITVRAVHIDRNTHSIKRSNYPASKWKEKNENHFDKSGEWSQKTITITSEVR